MKKIFLNEPVKVDLHGEIFEIVGFYISAYRNGDSMAVIAIFSDDNGQQIISVNLPDRTELLEDGQFFIKNWSENEKIVPALINAGIIQLTDLKVHTGYVDAPAGSLNMSKFETS